MINVPMGYQDAHGFIYNGGIILINHMAHTSHVSVQSNLELQPEALQYVTANEQAHAQLGFTAVIYPSQQALNERRPPLSFKPFGHAEYFNITLTEALNPTQMLAICEQWLLDNILSPGPEAT